jgi:N-acetyl sugar amidotransferase
MKLIKLPCPITQVCTRCVMDTSDPEIEFDESGVCIHCKKADILLLQKPYALEKKLKEKEFQSLINKIKADGKGKKYDCIIGLSGGVDSTYVAYVLKNAGLNPLAIHLDNGWNSELSVMNIESICRILNIELFTKVLNWEEFKDIQYSFLKSSTPDLEIPTDHAIFVTLFETAKQFNLKYILTGVNISTESIMPKTWSYGHWDWKYIKNIHKQFGKVKIKDYPHISFAKLLYYLKVKRIKWVNILNYLEYNKVDAKNVIQEKLNWRDYGGKHHESLYTKFYQTFILPNKFGIDKRKAHLSSLICSNQMTREEALLELNMPINSINELNAEKDYLEKKFNISSAEFDLIMNTTPKTFYEYPNSSELINKIQSIRRKYKND